MKKTYKAPNYKTIDLSGEAMIAQSGLDDGAGLNAQFYEDDATFVKAQGGKNLWDDEW